jgi:ribosomal protein L7/L12
VQTLLDTLARHTMVRPAVELTNDFYDLEKLSRADQDARLLELAESGDKIGAIALARRLYGYDLAQAKDFIERLISKSAPKI